MTLTFEVQKIIQVSAGKYQAKIIMRDTSMKTADTLIVSGPTYQEAKQAALDAIAERIS